MPALHEVLAQRTSEQDTRLLEGELVWRDGVAYMRMNGDSALLGPLEAAEGLDAEATVLVAVSHLGTYWVIADA